MSGPAPAGPGPACDPCVCPLCGQANACARAQALAWLQDGEAWQEPACWCSAERFAPALLARVPPAARGLACICQVCARTGA